MKIDKELNKCLTCKKSPCKYGCPLNNDILNIIKYLKKDNYQKAYFTLSKTTVLGALCGLICPKDIQCERMCKKVLDNNHVEIGMIEHYLSKYAIDHNYKIYSPKKTNKHVLVIGSGPASLTCAAFLRRNGIKVTIIEKHNYLGGLLVHGIPEFRLEKKLVKKVIDNIINLGIDVIYNKELGKDFTIDDVIDKYDRIFIGIGANISKELGLKKESLNNILGANELLENKLDINFKNKKVIVYGGGNTAMDMARTLKRLGARVTIIYRNNINNMKASKKEYLDTKEDKIKFLFNTNIIKLIGEKKLEKIEVINTKLNNKNELVNIKNTNYQIKCDYLIKAIGSNSDINLLNSLNLTLDENNKIDIDGNGNTSNPKIFSGGDVAGIKSTVASASRSGRNASYEIIKSLNI